MAGTPKLAIHCPQVVFAKIMASATITFLGLAVTYGRVVGPAFGGTGIVTIKPSVFAGDGRPGDLGLEVRYKLLGF